VAMEPKSNSIVLEQAARGRDQNTWQALMVRALAGLTCYVIQVTSDEAPGLLAYPMLNRPLGRITCRTSFMYNMNQSSGLRSHGREAAGSCNGCYRGASEA
jgi:hypothetical protein